MGLVNANLEVEGMQGIWALGDCALIPDPARGFCPPTAQHASREGKVPASNIIAGSPHQPLRAFRFKTLGLLASIGQRTGVARISALTFPALLPGGSGEQFISASFRVSKRKSGLRSIGHSTCFSRRTSFNTLTIAQGLSQPSTSTHGIQQSPFPFRTSQRCGDESPTVFR